MDALFAPGSMALGCNYWASHAGTAMRQDWQSETVEADLEELASHRVTWLRVFLLAPDFQPIAMLSGAHGAPVEVRMGKLPLPDDPVGGAGVSLVMVDGGWWMVDGGWWMVERCFAASCRIAERHGLQFVVGLVTGWVSGRLFVPPAHDGLDPITDPVSLTWQVRFVRTRLGELRDAAAIVVWDWATSATDR